VFLKDVKAGLAKQGFSPKALRGIKYVDNRKLQRGDDPEPYYANLVEFLTSHQFVKEWEELGFTKVRWE